MLVSSTGFGIRIQPWNLAFAFPDNRIILWKNQIDQAFFN